MQQPAFGQRLRALRVARGLSQAALAGEGMSTGYLSRLESGARPPTQRVLAHLARQLGTTTAVFDETGGPSLARAVATAASGLDGVAPPSAQEAGEQAEALADALRRPGGESDPAVRWQALWLLAGLRAAQGDTAQEEVVVAELVALADDLGAPQLRVRSLVRQARVLRLSGRPEQAAAVAAAAYALATEPGTELSTAERVAALQERVPAEVEAGRGYAAVAHVDELCALTATQGGPAHATALWTAATLHSRLGDDRRAQETLDRALAVLRGHDDPLLWMRLRLAAASLHLQATPPRTKQARADVLEVAPVVAHVGTTLHRVQLLSVQAHLAFADGRPEEAGRLCAAAAEHADLLSFRDGVRLAMLRHRLQIVDGERAAGIRGLEELAARVQAAGNIELAAELWRTLAETLAGPSEGPSAAADPAAVTAR